MERRPALLLLLQLQLGRRACRMKLGAFRRLLRHDLALPLPVLRTKSSPHVRRLAVQSLVEAASSFRNRVVLRGISLA